jgi:serine/threonine protein kinase
MDDQADWEQIIRLGGGGQSDVFLARCPERSRARNNALSQIGSAENSNYTTTADNRSKITKAFADAIVEYTRPDRPSELGALKMFKLRDSGPEGEEQAIGRLKQEILVLGQNWSGLPKLLDSNEAERWIVTEYFSGKTLEDHHSKYKGNAVLALKAFLSLVKTVANLHKDDIVHRDIKPANVFIRSDEELVLGDFGIVYLPDQPKRMARTNESVGPHDYMPPWADIGGRLVNVDARFDVYMLGKLLWCMVSGRLFLQREWFRDPENDLTMMFREDPHMYMVNTILEKCVVERQNECLSSAADLMLIVGAFVSTLEQGGQLLNDGVPRPCHVCGYGKYHEEISGAGKPMSSMRLWIGGSDTVNLGVQPYVCDQCGHIEFFKRV